MLRKSPVIDDLSDSPPHSLMGADWQLFTDQVMGGVSRGSMVRKAIGGRPAIHMGGNVSLENNGGFIQISLDLAPAEDVLDAGNWNGVEVDVYGKPCEYELRLRTSDLPERWQSYRQAFTVETSWKTVKLPFDQFVPHRTEFPLNIHRLRRLGLVAIGRAFSVDLALGGIRFFV
jgi:hypothetical protein